MTTHSSGSVQADYSVNYNTYTQDATVSPEVIATTFGQELVTAVTTGYIGGQAVFTDMIVDVSSLLFDGMYPFVVYVQA